jgi:hypothetical protein
MSNQNEKDRDALDRLVDGIVDGILNASDEEILAEVRERYGDEADFVADVDEVFDRAINEVRLRREPPAAAAGVSGSNKLIQLRDILSQTPLFVGAPGSGKTGLRTETDMSSIAMLDTTPEITAGEAAAQDDAAPGNFYEKLGYSKQFFTISRRGHTSATAEFGSPALVWHVSFWPKRKNDPFSIGLTDNGKIREDKDVVEEFGRARSRIIKDFNEFLRRIQTRGRHPAASLRQQPFTLLKPKDWDADAEPFDVFDSEATGFTLWWPDKPCDAGLGHPPKHMMSDRREAKPVRADLRVRVLAEAGIDYSTITFVVDAGKPWNEDPIYLSGDVPDDIGERRLKIFRHVKNIKTVSETRLDASDHEGKRLIDLDLLPEPNPICGMAKVKLEHGFTDSAAALKAAADYLYEDIWKDFRNDFGFDEKTIGGDTDVIFANFRGLVMSTCGTEATENEKTVKAPEPADLRDLAETAHPGSVRFPRFAGGGEGYASDFVEPNAVVKAYMPFMRRFRADADWRDWIACGIFDWRAIFITAVGAKSEFAAFDECDYDPELMLPKDIPAGNIPQRKVSTADMNDRPAPFRFLLLTKFEPNRKQVGRMVERVNTLGTRRLFALKGWSIIENASVWINHYGRQLDAAFAEWIRKTQDLRAETSAEIAKLRRDPNAVEENYRKIDGERDRKLADINRTAEEVLIAITQGLDKLGDGAVGGLPYRLARSRYYAETFRAAQKYLRVGNIETWWSYEQFAQRGMEPVLKFIESVGERLDKLRNRLQTTKQDILQRSIALQTEATRDNTYRLEQIWRELERMANETQQLRVDILEVVKETAEMRKRSAVFEQRQRFVNFILLTLPAWIGAAVAGAVWVAARFH